LNMPEGRPPEAPDLAAIRGVVRDEMARAFAARFPNGLSALVRTFVTSLAVGVAVMILVRR